MTNFADIPAGTWIIDPSHSTASFTIRHLAISKVKGRFTRFAGQIVTGDSLAAASAEGEVEVASIDTSNAQRDEHLRTNDFFDAAANPTISFRSTGVREGGDGLLVDGDFTMRGVTKPVTFDVEVGGVTTMGEDTKLGLEARATVSREAFGLVWNAPLETGGVVLGDDVKIELDLQAALEK